MGSFSFDGVDMYEAFGIRMYDAVGDFINPKLRTNKVTVPKKHGAVDFGAKYYDERTLTLKCASERVLNRAEVRELSAALAGKGRIILSTEPDKYYIGQLYAPQGFNPLDALGRGLDASLAFVCEPFAYGQQVTIDFKGSVKLAYKGTADTPTIITITNNNAYSVTGVSLILRRRVE